MQITFFFIQRIQVGRGIIVTTQRGPKKVRTKRSED
jgi:hypothetical protein